MEPQPYVEGALVSGLSAHVLDRLFRSPNVAQTLDRILLPPDMRAELEATRRAIRRAALAYAARPPAASGSTEAEALAVEAPSSHEITTAEASTLLALSDRRVRQLAAEGMGRRVGGRWLVDRSAVLAYAGRRREGL